MRQRFSYEYPGPIENLHQRLMVVPPPVHGDQRLRSHRVEADMAAGDRREGTDPFGNRVLSLHVPSVTRRVAFAIALEVERRGEPMAPRVARGAEQAYMHPTRLTAPDAALRRAARQFGGDPGEGLESRALAITHWVHETMTYAHDLTGVRTTAAEAFALRAGVCQDFAHVMLALCRLNGIPARYVSGHLLGEGGTHAWVEALTLSTDGRGTFEAHAFDPTHGRRAGPSYITVAVGRDYADVPPTSGSFTAPYAGVLVAGKQASILSLRFRSDDLGSEHRGAA